MRNHQSADWVRQDETLTAASLHGRIIGLPTAVPDSYSIRWKVVGYGSGKVKLQTLNSKRITYTDWPELRNHLRTGRLQVED